MQAHAAAKEADASSGEQLEELRQRIEARQRWLDDEQAALAAKVAEATAPAVAERDKRSTASAALRQEVQGLR